MDELVKTLRLPESLTSVVSVWQVIVGLTLSAALSLLIGLMYRRISSRSSYSQPLVHTFVLIGMVTAFIMTIIGSDIARAFSLVGALSIIRFRTAIKSPLDVAFVFFAISIGMGCGTGFFAMSAVGTCLILLAVYLMHAFDFAPYPESREVLLSVRFRLDVDYEAALRPLLGELFEAFSLAYVETVQAGAVREVVYSVRPRRGVTERRILDSVARLNDNLGVSYRVVRHAVDIP
ncbi:MAG: hypothetical protein A2X36_16750 [Elusimicrobia bacterium GWA2_69_24]|nr:MAG: hypothetical protein A2X36_16750 [Elusimicrobia bacterium GWA2_69_24]HBL16634.1 DUF4956 domain-containing protein [Elusimicrobiota bacterium]